MRRPIFFWSLILILLSGCGKESSSSPSSNSGGPLSPTPVPITSDENCMKEKISGFEWRENSLEKVASQFFFIKEECRSSKKELLDLLTKYLGGEF